jgi:ubiquinone/menaquinone biosynthesis C-methylase UbiE
LTKDSREEIRRTYGMSGEDYDQWRLVDPRGVLLSEYDVELFRELLPIPPPEAKVLEIGAGTGRFTLPALEEGLTLVAADINESLLSALREKVQGLGLESRCEVRNENIFELSYPNDTFDLIYTLHVIPRFLELADQRSALIEVARVIKPGGKLLFNYRSSRSFYNLAYSGHATNPTEIAAILNEAGMRIVSKRAKWFLNRRLINLVGVTLARGVAALDRLMQNTAPDYGWDVFVVAEKVGQPGSAAQ